MSKAYRGNIIEILTSVLYISNQGYSPPQIDNMSITWPWLELFQPFTSAKNLHPREEIAPVLGNIVGERATEVLPALENIFVEKFRPSEPVHEAVGQFIAARQLSGRPIVISRWERTHCGVGRR